VAQIYHDIAMASSGDLIVAYPEAPEQAFFIETWNTYTLRASDLGPRLISLGSKTMAAVDALREDCSATPPGFPITIPMRENDVRVFFREMEVETAYTFSLQAVSFLATGPEERIARLYGSAEEARDAVKALDPAVFWHHPPRTVLDVLLLARLPDERLPLAAADGSEAGNFAALYMLHNGRIAALSPLGFQIFGDVHSRGLRTLSGRIRGGSQELSGSDLICLCVISGGETISPSRLEWDDETGEFYAEFSFAEPEGESGEVSLALVKEADGIEQ
jgi:hypothetical protein